MPAAPRRPISRHALWVAGAAVLGLVALLLGAARMVDNSDGSLAGTTPPTDVITASPSPGTTAQLARPPSVGRELHPLGHGSCAAARGPVLRVLQFNIHAALDRSTGAVEASTIAAEIEARRPDLVSLDEVDSGTLRSHELDEPAYLAKATGLHVVFGPNLSYDGGRFGNVILSRYPVVASHNVRLPGAFGLEPRGLLTVTVRVAGRAVTFSSTHFSDGDGGRVSRVLQAQAVTQAIDHQAGPSILAGDLNAVPQDLPVHILRQHLLDSQISGGTGAGDTIPEVDPRSRFDYILYDNHFSAVPGSTSVLPSAVSDHRSVFTELALRRTACGAGSPAR